MIRSQARHPADPISLGIVKVDHDVQKAFQRGRSERDAEAYPMRYVEALSDARTKLEGFFNIVIAKVKNG